MSMSINECVISFVFLCCIIIINNIIDKRRPEIVKELPDREEFNRITMCLGFKKKILLENYFTVTNMSVESANTFLKSYRGMAFLKSYASLLYTRTDSIDEFKISQLILNAEKEEEIITCAVNVMKEHS